MRKGSGVISLYTITDVCLLYIGISSVFPLLNGYLGSIDTAICIGLNIVLLVVALTMLSKSSDSGTDIFLLVFFLFYSTVIPYFVGNTVIANRYLGILVFLVAPHIFRLYEQNEQIGRLKKISGVICFFAGLTFVTTATALLNNPYLSRSIKSTGDISATIKMSGIGGYEFVYFCMILGVAFFYRFWQEKKIWNLFGSMLVVFFLLLSNYITAVFLLVFGCILCLLSGKSDKQCFIAIIIIALLLFFSDFVQENIKNIVQTVSPTGRIARHINSNNAGLLDGLVAEFVYDRLPTMKISWKTIADSYGMGLLFSNKAQIEMLGQHSFVIDSLAVFGIPMGALYFYLVFRNLRIPVSCLVTFITLAVVNNMTTSIGIAIYFIIPILTMDKTKEVHEREVQNG